MPGEGGTARIIPSGPAVMSKVSSTGCWLRGCSAGCGRGQEPHAVSGDPTCRRSGQPL